MPVVELVPLAFVVAVVVCATFVVVFAAPAVVVTGLAVLAKAGATAYAPATYAGTAAMAQATTSDRIRPIAKASRPSPLWSWQAAFGYGPPSFDSQRSFRLARYNDHAAARAMGLSIRRAMTFAPCDQSSMSLRPAYPVSTSCQ